MENRESVREFFTNFKTGDIPIRLWYDNNGKYVPVSGNTDDTSSGEDIIENIGIYKDVLNKNLLDWKPVQLDDDYPDAVDFIIES